ncbi:MAG: histidine phosphatase family protein [Nitrosomonadaceae bacterium]|nr:histidine phosphatase family protein [Nitrosomonadaceae bacterium]
MTVSRIILLRHGETVWNRENRIQGHLDSPLSDAGIAQAEALAQRLTGETFAALYSSDLGRARETAERIAARTDHRIILDPALRERNLGILQGLIRAEARVLHPEIYTRYRTFDPDCVIPGGENALHFIARVAAAFSGIANRFPGKAVVVVTHGGVLDVMYRHASGVPLHGARTAPLPNAAFNCLVYVVGGRWSLPLWGDVTHLQDPLPGDP